MSSMKPQQSNLLFSKTYLVYLKLKSEDIFRKKIKKQGHSVLAWIIRHFVADILVMITKFIVLTV